MRSPEDGGANITIARGACVGSRALCTISDKPYRGVLRTDETTLNSHVST